MEKADLILSSAGAVLALLLIAVLIHRRLHSKYPFFFGYIIFSILATIAILSVSGNYQMVFKIFWGTEALYVLLSLLVLHEAFHDVFILDYRDWPWFWMVFPGAVLVLFVIFVSYALLHPPTGVSRIVAIILSSETVVNCVVGGLFLMFLASAWILLGESWPTYPYGVVLGFAVYSTGSLLAYWLFSIFGTKVNWLGKYGPPVSYILAVLIWIASCFLPPEPEDRWKNLTTHEQALATVRQYLRALRWMRGKDR
jgi:hypothetical protein